MRHRRHLTATLISIAIASYFSCEQHAGAKGEGSSGVAGPSSASSQSAQILVTTSANIEGYKITKYLGVIRGVTVRQPTVEQSIKASFKSIVGGRIGPYVTMCETARQQAYELLLERAQQAGANAVIAMRYDSSAFGIGSEMGTEVICYGTAVVIEPVGDTHQTSRIDITPQSSPPQ